MNRSIPTAVLILLCTAAPWAHGQMSGSRGGIGTGDGSIAGLPYLDRETVEGYITIEGRVERRVQPMEIRVVIAITGEGATAQECRNTVQGTIDSLKQAWSKIRIPTDRIVVDFIAVLPRYEWSIENRAQREVGIETKAGYRMQSNVHLAAQGDAEARAAIAAAFDQGITDILAFDYWSKDLDDIKAQARQQALSEARSKADVLLGALFEHRPPAINVQEQTTVHYPSSLYHSFQASHEESVSPPSRRDVPFIHAHRPRNTYYRGLMSDADVEPRELPMSPEISVVSTVRLYFESPAAERSRKHASKRKG